MLYCINPSSPASQEMFQNSVCLVLKKYAVGIFNLITLHYI